MTFTGTHSLLTLAAQNRFRIFWRSSSLRVGGHRLAQKATNPVLLPLAPAAIQSHMACTAERAVMHSA